MDSVLVFMFALLLLGVAVAAGLIAWRQYGPPAPPPPVARRRGLVVKGIDARARSLFFVADYGTAMQLMEYGGVHGRGRDEATGDLYWELYVSEFSDFTGTVLAIREMALALTPPPLHVFPRREGNGRDLVKR